MVCRKGPFWAPSFFLIMIVSVQMCPYLQLYMLMSQLYSVHIKMQLSLMHWQRFHLFYANNGLYLKVDKPKNLLVTLISLNDYDYSNSDSFVKLL